MRQGSDAAPAYWPSEGLKKLAPTRLLVLGAGPKALALAAKALVLTNCGYEVPEVAVVDRVGTATHWLGSFGYTDGRQVLGTPPEKDVGFPYQSEFGQNVDVEMMAYSWQAFNIETGRFRAWVDRGRHHPRHAWWGKYLKWVADKVRLSIHVGEVVGIADACDRWRLTYRGQGNRLNSIEGRGLVITGPGEPRRLRGSGHSQRVYDGKTFWENLDVFRRVRKRRGEETATVAVIGSGETASAVVLGLINTVNDEQVKILVINRSGSIFSRGESYHENALFSDPTIWKEIAEPDRQEFIDRTDRGVFSLHSQRVIDQAENVEHKRGAIIRIRKRADGRLDLLGGYDKSFVRYEADYVVDARGFDPLWFRRLLRPRFRRKLADSGTARAIQTDLSVRGVQPKLHLPMLAQLVEGPGFPNLSCLSTLSDRILRPYVRPPKSTRPKYS